MIQMQKGEPGMSISGVEANLLLYALDAYLGVDAKGRLFSTKHGYTRLEVQDLRDRLFAAHRHKEETED